MADAPDLGTQQNDALITAVNRFFRSKEISLDRKFLLAMSGGADSTALFHVLRMLKLDFGVAHVNYRLRGADSDADEAFVKKLCSVYGIPCYVHVCGSLDFKIKNIQLAAREIRYSFFELIMHQKGYDYLLTAHHRDDSVETMLINMGRGTGIQGMKGIPAVNGNILRPLIHNSRAEIIDFLSKHALSYRRDLSNEKTDYLRNFFRKDILPRIEAKSPSFIDGVSETMRHLEQTFDFIQTELGHKKKEACIRNDESIRVYQKQTVLDWHPVVQFEFFKELGFHHAVEIQKLLVSKPGSVFHSDLASVEIAAHEIITRLGSGKIPQPYLSGDHICLPKFLLTRYEMPVMQEIILDASAIQGELSLHQAASENYFSPSGMKGRKSVKKFLKDMGVSAADRDYAAVLTDGNEVVHAVLPWRVSSLHYPVERIQPENKRYFYVQFI